MNEVSARCQKFLALYFGLQNEVPHFGDLGLRLVSLGNPEKTVQGELQSFLSSELRTYKFVSECGIYNPGARRSLDLTVFDSNWRLICVIELKHYSRNQGSVAFLVNALKSDRFRHEGIFGAGVSLIQMGLYTEIIDVSKPYLSLDDRRECAHGLYRFVKTYCRKKLRSKCIAPLQTGDKYTFTSPEFVSFGLGERRIRGRVHSCISRSTLQPDGSIEL